MRRTTWAGFFFLAPFLFFFLASADLALCLRAWAFTWIDTFLGALLNMSWVDGSETDPEDDEEIKLSYKTFTTGLWIIGERIEELGVLN